MKHYYRPVLYRAAGSPTTFVLPAPVTDVDVSQPYKMDTREVPLKNGSYNYGFRRQARLITVSGGVDILENCEYDDDSAYDVLIALDLFLNLNGTLGDRFEFFTVYDDETPKYVKYRSCVPKSFNYKIRDDRNDSMFTYNIVFEAEDPYVWTTAPGVT